MRKKEKEEAAKGVLSRIVSADGSLWRKEKKEKLEEICKRDELFIMEDVTCQAYVAQSHRQCVPLLSQTFSRA
jgi:hypothetical protein